MMDNDFFAKLPQDVIFQILAKLPTQALLQLRCVAKSFIPLISHPHFLRLHLSSTATAPHTHHLLNYESPDYTKNYVSFHADKSFSSCKILETPFKSVNGYLRLVGSSRGVVCLFDTNYFTFLGTLILWNPFIGKFKILPCLERMNNLRGNFSHVAVGFGFDHRTADFAVVKILYDCDNELGLLPRAFVYGINCGSWRSVGLAVPCFMPRNWSSSVFVNGVVHWLAYKRREFNDHPNCIMGFDVGEDAFKLMELPQNLELNRKELRLSSLVDETSVALFVNNRENVGETWDVWLMNDYGKVESWARIYTVVLNQALFLLKIVNNGEILAAINSEKLILIDVENEEVKDLEVYGLPQTFYAAGYTPSLALLDVGEQLAG